MTLPWTRAGAQALVNTGMPPRWRLVFAALMVMVGAACMDGYPTHDVPTMDPLDMTQHQRLAQMNLLGGDAHLDRRWSYALLPGCVLRIDFDGKAGPRPPVDIHLLDASVKVATNKADDTFGVEVQQTHPSAPSEVTVFEAQKWIHAVRMSRTLLGIEKGCTDG